MRRHLHHLLASLILLGALASCEMFDDLINISFDTNTTHIDFTIHPAGTGIHTLVDTLLQSDIKAEIEDHGGDIESLDEITVSSAKLIVLTDGFTLDPFEWVEVYVATADVESIKIGTATIDDIGMLQVSLELTEENLMEVIEADEYIVTVVGELSEPITADVEMRLELIYHVMI